jgi:hypothetical protein
MNKILFSYIRNFVPLTKRIFTLLFKRRKKPEIDIQIKEQNKNFNSIINLELNLTDVFFIQINDNIYPILHKNCSLNITLPLKTQNQKFKIKAIGFFNSEVFEVVGGKFSKFEINSIVFDRLGKIADKKIVNNEPKISNSINIKNTIINSEPIISEMVELNSIKLKVNYNSDIAIKIDKSDLYNNLKKQLINE